MGTIKSAGDAARVFSALLMTGAVVGFAPATSAAAGRTPQAGLAASFKTGGTLAGVAATSARNAWAVGTTNSGKTLIVRWNGSAWKRARSPNPSLGAAAAC